MVKNILLSFLTCLAILTTFLSLMETFWYYVFKMTVWIASEVISIVAFSLSLCFQTLLCTGSCCMYPCLYESVIWWYDISYWQCSNLYSHMGAHDINYLKNISFSIKWKCSFLELLHERSSKVITLSLKLECMPLKFKLLYMIVAWTEGTGLKCAGPLGVWSVWYGQRL